MRSSVAADLLELLQEHPVSGFRNMIRMKNLSSPVRGEENCDNFGWEKLRDGYINKTPWWKIYQVNG